MTDTEFYAGVADERTWAYYERNVATDHETRTAQFDYVGSPIPLPPGHPRAWDAGGPDEGYPEHGYFVEPGWVPPEGWGLYDQNGDLT